MDLIKIGKFIADLRKEKKLTQEELAKKLSITDRAVSKWERGLSLPDADKMLELCSILDINVNELLSGEKIDMKNLNKKTEELLIDMAKGEETIKKRTIINAYIMLFIATIFYFGIIFLADYIFKEGFLLGTIIVIATILLVIMYFYGFKIEVDTGYYECKNCHHRYTSTYYKAIIAPHLGMTRYLKCPKCGKRTWSKKVMTKE